MRVMFPSGSARATFWLLFCGFILILLINMFLYDTYLENKVAGPRRGAVVHDVVRAISLSQIIPADKLKKNIRWLNGRGMSVRWLSQPSSGVATINHFNQKHLIIKFRKHFRNFKYNIPLSDGSWLLIQSWRPKRPWLASGYQMMFIVIILMIFLLCYWAIKRTAMPVDKLVNAADRFGRDFQAPPLAVEGAKEMRELIQAFNSMQSQTSGLITDRTQVLAAISHDLRTPITRLHLRVEYLEGTEQYEKACHDLHEMEQMISSILVFAKNHTSTERMERIDLVSLLDSICDEQIDTGADVKFQTECKRLVCLARLTSLKRAFNNLINNAIKYAGSALVTIDEESKKLVVKIQDQGPGIPEQELEKVFEPFYRVDQSRTPNNSGSGLGLAVTRDIIRSHGGEITIINVDDPKGLVVKVVLPKALIQ